MNMTRLKKLFISVLAVVAICCSIMSFTVFAADDVQWTAGDTTTAGWKYEQTVSIPTGLVNGKTATVTVRFPNGKTSSERLITLDVEGKYIVEYEAEGSVYEEEVIVRKDLFYVSSANSKAEYTTYKYTDHMEGPDDPNASTRESVRSSELTALQVNLAANDRFVYSRVIDLNGLTKEDKLINMVIAPNKVGQNDVDSLKIFLIDAYDESNYLTFTANQSGGNALIYMSANASNGQLPTGFNWNGPTKYVNTTYGTPMRFHFYGPSSRTEPGNTGVSSQNDVNYKIDTVADNDLSLSFDYELKQAFNTTSPHTASNPMIVDFDNPDHFENVWRGFTTGECYIAVEGASYVSDTFNFLITELRGCDDLSTNYFEDRGTLDIEVETGDYDFNNMPLAKVGTKYPVFTAGTINQYYGELTARYEVTDSNGAIVAKTGEDFIPSKAGDYTLTYIVEDYFGTTNKVSTKVTAVDATPAIEFDLEGIEAKGNAGVKRELAKAINLKGGSANGILDINKEVKYQDGTILEIENNKFFPTKAGTYTVTISATDYIGQVANQSYDVVIENGDRPVYIEEPIIPKYFISGQEYILPAINAYDYTQGLGTPVATKIAYIDGEGQKRALGTKITPVANEIRDTVDIIYYTNSVNAEGNIVFRNLPIREIMDGKYVEVSKLLASKDATIDTTYSDNITLKTAKDGATVELINPLGVAGLSIAFQGVKGMTNFDAFTITLSDSVNSAQNVKLIYYPYSATETLFKVNDSKATEYKAYQSILEGGDLRVEIDSATLKVRFDKDSAALVEIDKYYQEDGKGGAFKGFDSGKVYVTFGFEGVRGESMVSLVNVSGQVMSSESSRDRNAPSISINGEYLGYASIGDIIRIPKAIFTDLVDPTVIGTVTVQTPMDANGNRKTAVSVDGILLKDVSTERDYFVKVESYGNYRIAFYAEDFSGNPQDLVQMINVFDEVAPVITVNNNVKITGRVGQAITVPNAIATDNLDGNVKVKITIYAPSGSMYELKEGQNTFKTNRAGEYRVIYSARDAANNVAINRVTKITVNA